MKKLLLFATTAALILSSCSNDDEIGTQTGGTTATAIEFRSLTDKSTKAAITDGDNILSFTVTGQKQSDKGHLFNGFGITRGEGSNWAYTPLRYWPAGDKVNFYAYSPTASRNIKAGEGLTGFDYSAPAAFTYTVPTIKENDAQEDFLIARLIDQDESVGSVKLNFQHALSRVKFFAKTTQKNITYIITGVELVNLNSTATMDLTSTDIPESGAFTYNTTTPLLIWDGHTTPENYSVDMGKSPIYMTTDFSSVLGVTNALMVMPQTTSLYNAGKPGSTAPTSEFAVKVSYKAFVDDIYYAGSATTSAVKYFPVPPTNTFTNFAFEIGRQYNFFLTFGDEVGDPIQFEVGVSEWDDNPGQLLPELTDYTSLLNPLLVALLDATTTSGDITIADGCKITSMNYTKTAAGNGDGKVSYNELGVLKSITFTGDVKHVEHLKGFEYLYNLETLNFNAVGFENMNIGDLKIYPMKLTTLGIRYGSKVDKLDLSNLKQLTLDYGNSNLTIPTLVLWDGYTSGSLKLVYSNNAILTITNIVDKNGDPYRKADGTLFTVSDF